MKQDIRNLLYAGAVVVALGIGYVGGRVHQFGQDLESVVSTNRATSALNCGIVRVADKMTSENPIIYGLASMLDLPTMLNIPKLRVIPTIEETTEAVRVACKK